MGFTRLEIIMAYADQINGVDVDRSYTRVTNLNGCRVPYVRSFEIIEGNGKYALKINTNKLIGTYPTVNAALGALIGCFHSARCNEEVAIHQIETLVAEGKGVIPATFLQQITFTFADLTLITNAISADSSGLEIINPLKLSQLLYTGTQPRLWNGAETGLSSPYEFTDPLDSQAYWAQYKVVAQVNFGPEIDFGDPVAGNAFSGYLNTLTSLSVGPLPAGPGTITYTVSGAS